MRVFLTGASGFVGSAVVQELIGAGHQVVGLARSDSSAEQLLAAGIEVHRGALDDLESLKSGAAAADGVIHTAFIHDFKDYEAACKTDTLAVQTIAEALAGSDRPFVITSGIAMLKPGTVGTENDMPDPNSAASHRIASEKAILAMAAKGVRSSVVRLPPSVHGDGDHGFVPALINIARQKGVAAYVGEGLNRWPAVHRLDAARLFRLALEKGAAGSIFHGVADEGVPMRDIVEVISRHLNVPVVSKTAQEAAEHFGWLAYFVGVDCPASSLQTQTQLGWTPVQTALLPDIDLGTYFNS
ncbi:SDR family oxidoreductase [Mucilaginibacter sp. Bleaf8]|uniref:SDR family oxidoreductase n=1 Tax=Mucilaginibacter sp. Bleaf8 TaxID=2834430 RepID=UPI001BCC1418|nr:SDR family oxidoreductase [Mucilaginibacter sp. Bleaf8]MBS7563690.1 SDR family oxidoreductase [Mucilaginibacter sp. Bleaf8]